MKKLISRAIVLICIATLAGCSSGGSADNQQASVPSTESSDENTLQSDNTDIQNHLGALSPEDALEYMKATPGLVIVEVNTPEWKLSTGFTGALYIPYTEMGERYHEIPQDRPVILHCGGGIVSVEAYEVLQEKLPDIPQLSYIAGSPPISAYNEWLSNQ